ncbi:MAG TPA: hypothetical protein PKK74_06560 [Candidatus Methanoculleus thermohydrogenotrophicum]|jgi:hypothetical protein|nr:hypothetical protein [Candidatus Methanoculleus thermohydrogenotrophicum]NLM81312.1 hypothetical protein [Candidatus Methanoculleus thermohydrogenotrophicum]HOB18338.1 hypothetical protein [Candidatus Methanoculleus thermohydrogenotrophicum]HPZ37825.1 hypothetical protein [Candidatus Methanoculleus thermohydrogenotrophicum]HQC91051.1 hypothetical protein [Candidatus Methanoculleus thermohydrogenotrophicum]
MDLKTAIRTYQFAERAKSELIVASQLTAALIQFPIQEKPGGKRMLLLLLGSIRSELEFAYGDTERREFRKAIDHLNEVISLTESMELGAASERIGKAVSAVTTAAQAAWDMLKEHELL